MSVLSGKALRVAVLGLHPDSRSVQNPVGTVTSAWTITEQPTDAGPRLGREQHICAVTTGGSWT